MRKHFHCVVLAGQSRFTFSLPGRAGRRADSHDELGEIGSLLIKAVNCGFKPVFCLAVRRFQKGRGHNARVPAMEIPEVVDDIGKIACRMATPQEFVSTCIYMRGRSVLCGKRDDDGWQPSRRLIFHRSGCHVDPLPFSTRPAENPCGWRALYERRKGFVYAGPFFKNVGQRLWLHCSGKSPWPKCVAPGPFPTENAWAKLNPLGTAKGVATEADQIPLRRHGRMDELRNLMIFLMSDGCDFITGQTIAIDGGHHLAAPSTFAGLSDMTDADWKKAREAIAASVEKEKAGRKA